MVERFWQPWILLLLLLPGSCSADPALEKCAADVAVHGLPRGRRALLQANGSTTPSGVFASAVNELATYPVDWAQVPTVAVSPSPVQVTGLGTCACDLTALGCDPNCCCDPDCDTPLQDLFTGCLPREPPSPSLDYCLPAAQIARVNLDNSGGYGVVETQRPDSGFLSKQLCIVRENKAELGQFFSDPAPARVEDLAAAATQPDEFSFAKPDPPRASGGSATYKVNASLPAAYDLPGGSAWVAAEGGGVLAVPAPALSAACDRLAVVGFMMPVEGSVCERYSADLAADCSALMSARRYINWLQIGKTGGATPGQQGGYVAVTVTGAQTLDTARGGALTDITPLPTAAAFPTAVFDNVSLTCENALQKVAFTISHNGRGAVTKVEAAVVLTAVPAGADGGGALRQLYSVAWVRDGTAAVVRPKSGNPGYMPGMPILAGGVVTQGSKQAVGRSTGGLPISVAGPGGVCGPNYVAPVAFGADSITTCHVAFTRSQLSTFCRDTMAPPLPLQLLGGLFGAGQEVYVGGWANADVSNVGGWRKVLLQGGDPPMVWDEASSTCLRVPAGLKYEILTSKVGARDNPQRQISFVRVSFQASDWTFQDPGASSAAQQRFVLQQTVQFLPLHQADAVGVSPPPPPLLPTLPDDIFYPFYISSTYRLSANAWLLVLCLVLASQHFCVCQV